MDTWRTPADLLALACVLLTAAMLAVAGALLGGTPPMPSYGPAREQTPIPWATAAPTPTMRPFAAHGSPAPAAPVRIYCFGQFADRRCPVPDAMRHGPGVH